jgi:hypothetical protein
VKIQTSVAGFAQTWKAVFERLLAHHPAAANIEINDFDATPRPAPWRCVCARPSRSASHE